MRGRRFLREDQRGETRLSIDEKLPGQHAMAMRREKKQHGIGSIHQRKDQHLADTKGQSLKHLTPFASLSADACSVIHASKSANRR